MVQILLLEVAARKINTMANCRIALKGGFYGSAYVLYYLFPYARFLAQAQFFIHCLWTNREQVTWFRIIIKRRINHAGQN